MRRTRKSLGAPEPGPALGIPTPLLVGGVLAALGLAWLNAGSGDPTPPAGTAAGGTTTPTGGTSTGGGSSSGSTGTSSGSTSTPKPKRRAITKAASPLLYVFVNSIGGEGIFDRLKTTSSLLDGNGLNRIVTLDNHEYAGLATGNTWTAPDTGNVYIQLYEVFNNIGYNWWIQQKETVALHAEAAYTSYGWGDNVRMTDTHKALIAQFYFTNYQMP